MMSAHLKKVVKMIKTEREKIWLHRPEDIKTLKKRVGPMKQKFTTIIYADNDTQSVVKYLYNLREVSKLAGIDLETLKKVTLMQLQFDQKRATIYYHLGNTAKIFTRTVEAIQEVRSTEDYRDLIGEMLLYIGKLNYWIDLEIPWNKLAITFRSS